MTITIPIFTAWIIMLCLGVIGHELDKPELFVSYWLVLAVCTLTTVPFALMRWALQKEV